MAIYELRTYDIIVGHMGDVQKLYQTLGYPALEKGGFTKNLISYFTGDIGAMNEIVHLWKFEDANDRAAFWRSVYADEGFMKFAGQLRPHLTRQQNKLLNAAPWGQAL